MFIKQTKSGKYNYLSLVESYRDESGATRHRVLYRFGSLDVLRGDESFIRSVKALCRFMEVPLLEDDRKPVLGDCSEAEMLRYGYLPYLKLWRSLGIEDILKSTAKDTRVRTLDLQRTTFLMAIQHLLSPRSKLGTYDRQEEYYAMPLIPLQHFYRALDKLAENKEQIEGKLFERNHLKNGQEVDVVFYDVTTFAFQSVERDELRDFGFSKDCKFSEVQVVMGLLLDSEGMPLGYELFPGNTFDGKTMVDSLKNLKSKFNIHKVVIVADRGLNSKGNLELIREAGYGYIMACRLRSMPKEIQDKAVDEAGYITVGDGFKYKSIEYENCFKDAEKNTHKMSESIILSWSRSRAEKDAKDRERLIVKAKKLLSKPGAIEQSSKRGGKKYLTDKSDKRSDWALDESKIVTDAKLDGFYGIQTSEKSMDATAVMDAYHMLWKIEDSFRVMKSTMEVRPIFHWTAKRIRGHFMMCFLAFMIERKLERLLPAPSEKDAPNSPERIREALLTMRLAKITTNGETLYLKAKNASLGTKIFKAVGVNLPKNVSRENELQSVLDVDPEKYNGQISLF